MVKPIPRWQIALAKGLVAAGLTAALVVPSVVLTGLLLGGRGRSRRRPSSASPSPAWSAAAPTPCAFMALSAFTSRALLIGLAYTLIWEGVLAGLLEGTTFLSIRQATLGLAAALGGDVPGRSAGRRSSASSILGGRASSARFLLASWQLARFEIRGGD